MSTLYRKVPERMKRFGYYFLGLLILALGLVLNSKTGLGVTPIVSVAYVSSVIFGYSFADMTLVLYILFILVQFIIHLVQKKNKVVFLQDFAQILVSLIFTRIMNLFSVYIPMIENNMFLSIILLVIAIVCTGIGAALSLDMRLIPNPGDGIVGTLSDTFSINMGTMKNIFDFGSILIALVLSYICTRSIVGIGIGTFIAMVGVGRTIAFFNSLTHLDAFVAKQ